MLVGKIYDEASYLVSMKSRVDNKEKRVSNGEACNCDNYDELCYMFANI